jgi:chromosome segregation ATPase
MSENISFLGNLWRLISFYKIRKALGLARAADAQFTGSAAGVSDAYDIKHDSLVGDYNALLAAVSQVEHAIEQKRGRRPAIEKRLAEAQAALNGAVRKYTAEKEKGDKANEQELAKHKTNGTTFKADVDKLVKQLADLDAEIKASEPQLVQLEGRLTAMQKQIRDLPQEKAEAIAKYVSNKAIIEANKRLNNLKTSAERSPVDAVEEALAQQTAEATVSTRIAGTDSNAVVDEYVKEGAASAASDGFEALVAAHAAKTAEKTGDAPVAASADHEKI